MITGFDHVVILSGTLSDAIRWYQALGFTVERGGVHPAWGTENALIPLADGSYLELMAARDPSRAAQHRLWQRADGSVRQPGEYGGYALTTDNLTADLARIQARGALFQDPQAGSRERLDKQLVRWRAADATAPGLPFLIEDVTPRVLRIAAAHGLGASARLAAIEVAVEDLAQATRLYEQLLDLRPTTGADRVHFEAPWGKIVLFRPHADDPARTSVQLAGPHVFSTILEVHRWAEVTQGLAAMLHSAADEAVIRPELLGGTRIVLRPTSGST